MSGSKSRHLVTTKESQILHSQFELATPDSTQKLHRKFSVSHVSEELLEESPYAFVQHYPGYGAVEDCEAQNSGHLQKHQLQKYLLGFGVLISAALICSFQSVLTSNVQTSIQSAHSRHFLHLTDLHIDAYYKENALAKYWCHMAISQKSAPEKGDDLRQAPFWGLPTSQCDTPINLVNASFAFMQTLPVEFVLYTGDGARHENDDSIPRPLSEIYDLNRQLTALFNAHFAVPIVPTLGNNDVFPHQQIAYSETGNEILEEYTDIWRDFIPADQVDTFRRLGSFARMLAPGQAVISLNTLYFFQQNNASGVGNCMAKHHSDTYNSKLKPMVAGDHLFEWLHDTLQFYQQQNIKTYIIGHVAPSKFLYYEGCFHRYAELAVKFSQVVTYHAFGHQNVDHFFFLNKKGDAQVDQVDLYAKDSQDWVKAMSRLEWCRGANPFLPPESAEMHSSKSMVSLFEYLLDQYKQLPHPKKTLSPFAVVHVAPSIIPTFYPSFRLVEFEQDGLVDWRQYFLNLTEWNANPRPVLTYDVEYSLRSAYGDSLNAFGLKRGVLTTQDWVHLAKRIARQDKLKKTYAKFMIVSSEAEQLVEK